MTVALGRTIRFTGSWRPVTLLAILGGVLLTSQGGRIAIAADAPKVAPPADPTRIAELITQLGSDDYFNREKAQAELTAVGAEAFDALSEALDTARDVEVIERAAYLLRMIKVQWVEKDDPLEVRNLLQNYEGMDEETRQTVIDQLAQLPDLKPLAALCRIVRFERSQALSKRAAVRLMDQKLAEGADWSARETALRLGLETSPRAPADWIRIYLAAHQSPGDAVAPLRKQIDAEMDVLRQYPRRTSPEILMSLWRRLADMLKGLDRRQDAVDAMMQMVALEKSGTTVLTAVLDWLMEVKAWPEIDELAMRFPGRFEQDALLLYTWADAKRRQEKKVEAGEIVARARKLNVEDQRRHLITGLELHRRGLIDWSEQEYQDAVGMGTPGQALTLTAQFLLSESMHDREADDEAAKVLDAATKGMEAAAAQGLDISDAQRSPEANRARAHYFYALHYQRMGDQEQALKHLLEGLGEDQFDAEILIALFQMPDLDTSVRDRVRKLIRESAAVYRRQMQETPDDDTPYNQLAWLISNTEGDFQEAVKASQKSLEIKPDSAGHRDTLGRCYYAVGDLDNAIKYQKEALEMEPHSQQMRRQLALFEAAKAKKDGKK